MNFRISRALPRGASGHADGRCWAGSPICLRPGGDACVLGVVERAGNALYLASSVRSARLV
jgi:hypothetical protein